VSGRQQLQHHGWLAADGSAAARQLCGKQAAHCSSASLFTHGMCSSVHCMVQQRSDQCACFAVPQLPQAARCDHVEEQLWADMPSCCAELSMPVLDVALHTAAAAPCLLPPHNEQAAAGGAALARRAAHGDTAQQVGVHTLKQAAVAAHRTWSAVSNHL
jgi:hypothetical protein